MSGDPVPASPAHRQIPIRTVKVELLRTGPAHNQLLSPLTPYLGICDGGEAGVVHVPFEHAAFLRRFEELRATDLAARSRSPVLRDLAVDIGRLLGAVPRLPGSLGGERGGPDTLVHLRLVLSASELALLPFELSKVPVGPAMVDEGWLSLQARAPVVITRRTRDASGSRVRWPSEPRILFVASDPVRDGIPFDEHRRVLLDAVGPYLRLADREPVLTERDGRPWRERYGDQLTILRDARFDDVVAECAAQRFTHVHLLAHGAEDTQAPERAYGLVLRGADGEDDDVVSGERLASAFASLADGSIHRPTVVTLATCDSGNVGSVLVPGASLAHALHQAGIALVVGSQFPLSMDGSCLLLRQLVPGLLAGEHPLPLLHRIRTELHGRWSTRFHDWACLVVYEALPDPMVLQGQLDDVRLAQAVRALNMSFGGLDRAVARGALADAEYRDRCGEVVRRMAALPLDGPYRLECQGWRGSANKRLAAAAFARAAAASGDADADAGRTHLATCCERLEDAFQDYTAAVAGFLRHQGAGTRKSASMHWVMGQQLCIAAVLGKPVRAGTWQAAELSARAFAEDATDAEERGYAMGSLVELWLLRAVDDALASATAGGDAGPVAAGATAAADQARTWARALVALARSREDRTVESTRRQLARYVDWWSDPAFEAAAEGWGGERRSSPGQRWQDLGVHRLAQELHRLLDMQGGPARPPADVGVTAAPPAPSPAPAANAPAAPPADAPSMLGGTARPRASGAFLRIEMLPARHGDCLWIEYGRGRRRSRVLVDCGTAGVWRSQLKPRIEALPPAQRRFELFVLSHVDDDHIGGGIELLEEAPALGLAFGDVWFNGWKHLAPLGFLGARQGEQFSQLIRRQKLPWNQAFGGVAAMLPPPGSPLPVHRLPGGLVLTLLSPDEGKLRRLAPVWKAEIAKLGKTPGSDDFLSGTARATDSTDVAALADEPFESDAAEANGSSIALLAEFEGRRVLLGADAHAPLLAAAIDRLLAERGLRRLEVDAFKLPHHGSRNNLSRELLQRVRCRDYLVSSNGHRFGHPDRQAVARVIRDGGPGARLHFNYRSGFNAVWADPALQARHGYTAVYPADGQEGLVVTL